MAVQAESREFKDAVYSLTYSTLKAPLYLHLFTPTHKRMGPDISPTPN